MVEIYRNLLIIICIGLLVWGIVRIERIYQYPFFMGSMFTSFVLPQIFSLIQKPGVVTQEALERVILVSCLSAATCWIGYATKPNKKLLAKLNVPIDERKLFQAGLVLMAQGHLFNFLLSRTAIQHSENVGGNWTGPATIYLFFSQVTNIAFGIFLLQALKRPKPINIACAVISAWPLISSIIVGRRQGTMTFIIIIGLSLYLVRRYVPPRVLVVTAIFMMTLIIPALGVIRGEFWNLLFSGQWQQLSSVIQGAFEFQQGGDILEMRNAALLMDAVERTGLYGYGSGWWDSIVFQYVPGQIVGQGFKESLKFNLLDLDLLNKLYGYRVPTGSTITGIGDSFMEFSFLGFLIFGMIGYIFKTLWISSLYYQSTYSRLLYMGLVSPAMVGLTHGIGRFWQEGIFQVFFVSVAIYYSRLKYKF
ncbi:hypothetical protein VB735_08550 [Halotia wernerae UHCC 0503]|nr:hypothetical protein [Halotia wernerae UHCC 0503]